MAGRRRDHRFRIANPWSGWLRVLREVPVAAAANRCLTVISRSAVVAGEVMRLHVSSAARGVTLRVRVVGSRPVTHHGEVQQAVDVEVLRIVRWQRGTSVGPRRAEDLRELLGAADIVGVLTRRIGARTLNVSGSGCLLETSRALDEGTVAQLRMRIGEVDYRDDVRVTRCGRVEGAGATCRVGVEFLWTRQPGVRSLRRLCRALPDRLVGSGVEMSNPAAAM